MLVFKGDTRQNLDSTLVYRSPANYSVSIKIKFQKQLTGSI